MFESYNPTFWNQQIKHRHLVIFLLGLSTILLSISIIGCSSSSGANPNLHLVEIKYDAYGQWFMKAGVDGTVNADAYNVLNAYTINSDLQVRIGYFGICTNSSYPIPIVVQNQLGSLAPKPSNASTAGWICSNNVTKLANEFTWPTQDALNLIYVADAVRAHTLTPWVLIIAIVLSGISCILLIMVNHTGSAAFPLTTGVTSLSFLVCILGMTSQQTGINAISQMSFALSQNSVKASSGKSAAGLGWSATVFLFISTIALVLIYINEKGIRARDSDIEEKITRDMMQLPPKMTLDEAVAEEQAVEQAMEEKIMNAQERAAAEQAAEEYAVAFDTAAREAALREAAARENASRQAVSRLSAYERRTPSPSAESRPFRMPGTISMPTPY